MTETAAQRRERERQQAQREREREQAQREREREQAQRERERQQAQAQREREQAQRERERQQAQAQREREREQAQRERERQQAQAQREREQAQRERERQQAQAQREREREQAQRERERQQAQAQRERERQQAQAQRGGSERERVLAALEGNNRLTQSEIRNLTEAGIDMDKILTVAAKNNATIGQNAQQVYGIDQNNRGVISYSPGANADPPKPGSGWAITGSQATQTRSPNGGVAVNQSPVYTYMAPTKTEVTQAPSPSPSPSPEPAPGAAPATAATESWSNSIDSGTQAMIDALNQSILDNQANQQLYMGMMSDMMSQMAAVQQPQQAATPYAVTTSTNAPAQGAQMTQAIAPRKKNLNTSLAIAPLETAGAGTGLNIPV